MRNFLAFIFLLLFFLSSLFFSAVALAGAGLEGEFCCANSDCDENLKLECGDSQNPKICSKSDDCKITVSGESRTAKGIPSVCVMPGDRNKSYVCPLGPFDFLSLFQIITNYIFYLSLIIVPLIILLGAFFIMTARGEPEKIRKGRAYIIWAGIGLAVMLSAKVFYGIIKSIITGP